MSDQRLGWIKDKEDKRDFKFSLKTLEPIQSVYINHTHRFPLPYDQGPIGSCVANAIAFQIQVNLLNNRSLAKHNPFCASRLFIYYYQRELIGTIDYDSGSYIRDGIKVVADKGAPSEDLWHYNISELTTQPDEKAIRKALEFQSLKYERIDQTNKQLLVNALKLGLPIAFGIYVYDSFLSQYTAITGLVSYPDFRRESIQGGHAMTIVGYRQKDDSFIVRNSWGTQWGQKGYCRIPASYITNPWLTDDFWVISEME